MIRAIRMEALQDQRVSAASDKLCAAPQHCTLARYGITVLIRRHIKVECAASQLDSLAAGLAKARTITLCTKRIIWTRLGLTVHTS